MKKPLNYDSDVFINCPFDPEYKPLLEAIAFAVHDCGFRIRCALESDDNMEARLEKIKRIIGECRLGIHDVSRTQTTKINDQHYPRFNMPYELGLFMGCKQWGDVQDKKKQALILDKNRDQTKFTTSDLAGLDPRYHDSDISKAVEQVCQWLSIVSGDLKKVPGATAVLKRYDLFLEEFPQLCVELERTQEEVSFGDYSRIVAEWLRNYYQAPI